MQLPESLGEIDHMFCDKTGTLTQNDLDVRSISVSGTVVKGSTREELVKIMQEQCDTEQAENLIKCFCLCNDMRVAYNSKTGKATYDGSSQDEMLLLLLSQESTFYELSKRDQYSITLIDKRTMAMIVFPIIRNVSFTVERKKQSMVVKDPRDGRFYVFAKGADEAIFPLLEQDQMKE